MIKILILGVIAYFFYKSFKSWMLKNTDPGRRVNGKTVGEIDDIMIKDPFCNTYFPKRDGVHLKADGKDLYFCSAECRDKFIESRSDENK